MTIPRLDSGNFGVLFAEIATGKVLGLDGERYAGVGEFYAVFDSLERAQTYAKARVGAVLGIEVPYETVRGIIWHL
jgi:hypothetical protein